jgi:hypothetical protein
MDQLLMQKTAVSPVSTGGGGSDYERQVGACYLAMALLRTVPRGQAAGLAREVRFQRLYEGEPLDDLVIVSDLPVGEAKLALQIKRDLTFGERDPIFDEVLRACWATFTSSRFTLGIDRFGIVIGLYSKKIDEHFQSVLTWARSSANATDFLSRVSQGGLSNKTQRSFVELIRSKLNACAGSKISDDDLWGFLRSMVILHFDLQQDASRDYSYVVEILSHVLPPEKKAEAPRLFSKLFEYAAEGNRTAGSYDSVTLRQRLQTDGFPLLPALDCRDDLERLREHAEFILRDIRTDIGGLVINRDAFVADAQEKMREGGLLELVGVPGAGKSAVLKAFVEHQQGDGPVVVFAWDRLTGPGWNSFARDLQLTRPLHEILVAVSSGSRPCIFIDGVDRIVDHGARLVINDLLRSLAKVPLSRDNSQSWSVVVSCREENLQELDTWLDWQAVGQPKLFPISEFTQDEVKLVAEQSPRLRPLLSLRQLDPILQNPFMLRLLEDQRMLPDPGAPPPIATEIEVSMVWWERLVGGDGVLGRARQQALLEFGRRTVKAPGWRLSEEGIPAEVLKSLESDRILLRDAGRDVYRFSHDLLEDWVLYRVLDQHRDDLATYLRQAGQPFGLFRPVQLLALFVLERDEPTDAWRQLVEQVEQATDLAPRWRQALLTAPLLSPRMRDLLEKIESLLSADGHRRLSDLLVALRTVEVTPDVSLIPAAAAVAKSSDEILSLLLNSPVPNWRSWAPFMGWLLERVDTWPPHVRIEAIKLMELWQKKSPTGSIYRKDIGEKALAWLQLVERWYHNDDL